jgi:hypothetical protein
VDVDEEVVAGGGVGTVVAKGLIVASVGLVQPAKSTQTMSTNVVKRTLVHFMKNAFGFLIFLISASGAIKVHLLLS